MNALARLEPLRNGGAAPNPWSLLDEVFQGVPTLFAPIARRTTWSGPRFDVAENDKAYLLAVEMPGVARDRMKVEVYENNVTISAEAAPMPEEEGTRWLLRERATGKFSRTLTLPEAVDEDASNARFADGVLYLTLQKKRASQVRRLEIH